MAGRKTKETVDYFPHYCIHGKLLFIVEAMYGNDGYSFFYKLLELLGKEDGHYFRIENEEDKQFLAAATGVSWEIAEELLGKMAAMERIDRELWEDHQTIWMQSFVDSLVEAYRKRTNPVPEKPFLPEEIHKGVNNGRIDGGENTQTKLDKIKVNKTKEKKERVKFVKPALKEVQDYCRERKNNVNPQTWIDHYESKGWMIGKNKMVDWKAAVRTWESRDGGTTGNVQSTPSQRICKKCGQERTAFTDDGICLQCKYPGM